MPPVVGFIMFSVLFILFFSSLLFVYKANKAYRIKDKEIEQRIWGGLRHEIDRADRRARKYYDL